jgi:hypothetical protein
MKPRGIAEKSAIRIGRKPVAEGGSLTDIKQNTAVQPRRQAHSIGHRSFCGRSPRLADHRRDDTIPTMIIDDMDMTIRAAIDSVGLAFSR